MIPQDEILGRLAHEQQPKAHRTTSFPRQPSLRDCSCFALPTQDFILGYFQSSLRDWGTGQLWRG
jgi:hypothetical protein